MRTAHVFVVESLAECGRPPTITVAATRPVLETESRTMLYDVVRLPTTSRPVVSLQTVAADQFVATTTSRSSPDVERRERGVGWGQETKLSLIENHLSHANDTKHFHQ